MTFVLLVQDEGSDPRVFTNPFSIGTAQDVDLRLSGDSYVSARHAVCHPYEGDWYLEDLGSISGTLVNGIKIWGPYRLEKGDRVKVGRTVLTVVPA